MYKPEVETKLVRMFSCQLGQFMNNKKKLQDSWSKNNTTK